MKINVTVSYIIFIPRIIAFNYNNIVRLCSVHKIIVVNYSTMPPFIVR